MSRVKLSTFDIFFIKTQLINFYNNFNIFVNFSLSSIIFFFVNFLANFLFESEIKSYILPISSRISKSFLSGLILIILNPVFSFIIFSLFSSSTSFLSMCPFQFLAYEQEEQDQ